ncbi:MAG: T9SS type A sorting domain-containing protein [Bacteroidota bacterium]
MFDQSGRLVDTVHDGFAPMDVSKDDKHMEGYFWRPTNVPAGIYFVKIQVGGETFVKTIIKVNE